MDALMLKDFPIYRQNDWKSDGEIPYLELTLAFSVLVFLFEIYLELRQLTLFKTVKEVPKEIKSIVPEDTFTKSNLYNIDKFTFGLFSSSFMFAEGTALVLLGYLPYSWDVAKFFAEHFHIITADNSEIYQEIMTTCFFVIVMMMHDTVLSLPFSIYSTFVIEQKHGFNKSTFALFVRDKLVGIALSIVIGSPIISVVVYLIRLGGPHFYFYVWVFLCIVSIILMTVYPTLIAPLFNKYTPLTEGPVFDKIKELASRDDVKFPLTQLFTMDGSKRSGHSNAFFYGFFKNKRIVLYDTLMTQVDTEELLAILGHEIGHWKLWHTIQGFVITQAYTFCLFLAFSFVQNTPGLFAAFGFAYHENMPVIVGLYLFIQTFWTPIDKMLNVILIYNSRVNEFAADAFAVKLGMGAPLASGLIKISLENLGNMVPDSLYSAYHFSHPPLVERLRALQPKKKSD